MSFEWCIRLRLQNSKSKTLRDVEIDESCVVSKGVTTLYGLNFLAAQLVSLIC
jgi:hypothetical protein